MVGANHTAYTNRFHELAKLVPRLVTSESSRIKRYIAGLAPKIRGMLRVTQPTTIQSVILRARILTDEAVNCGTLTKRLCYNCQKLGHFSKDCQASFKKVALVNAVRMGYNKRVCYECGSPDHLTILVPKCSTHLDPNVVTGTFSLNDHFATALFDSRADFSFISTDFAPLLNMKPSFVNPGYMIEVADGKKVKVDRIILNYKQELGNSLFTINLIPLGYGSFDVQGERTLGVAKALMNAKVDEPKLSDIPVVRDFTDVFPEDLSGLPPQ
ncbi:putative reverse transcriptase domain-containing protein [Tanacetum coccineum]